MPIYLLIPCQCVVCNREQSALSLWWWWWWWWRETLLPPAGKSVAVQWTRKGDVWPHIIIVWKDLRDLTLHPSSPRQRWERRKVLVKAVNDECR